MFDFLSKLFGEPKQQGPRPEYCNKCGTSLVYRDASYPEDEKRGAFNSHTGERLPVIKYGFWYCPACSVVKWHEGKPPKPEYTDM